MVSIDERPDERPRERQSALGSGELGAAEER
jgi:hypothetical protein